MNIQNYNLRFNNVSFMGHKKELDKAGYEQHKFYYLYDKEKYQCDVEIYNLEKDNKGNFSVGDLVATEPMPNGEVTLDMNNVDGLYSNDGFAYRFKLTAVKTEDTSIKTKDTSLKTEDISYAFDNGTVIGIFDNLDTTDNKFNVVLKNRALINKNGPMKLIMPDEFNPKGPVSISEALRAQTMAGISRPSSYADNIVVRNHANKLGGTFEGIIEKLPEIKAEGISRIVGMPYTKDTISSHKYWTENAYRVAPDFGGEKAFEKMQIELFKNGINWVADAALVNEGLGGIHIAELMRKGSESESKNMFRASGKLKLGILPNKSEFVRMKLINSPYIVSDDKTGIVENPNYNVAKPTYLQYYDDRLASKEQKESDEVITTYAYNNTGNVYDITNHDDAVYPYSVEVSPSELESRLRKTLDSEKSIDLSNIDTIKKVSDFQNFSVMEKSAAGNLEVWDGNVDIPKLNFFMSNRDHEITDKSSSEDRTAQLQNFERGTLAVRDYAVTSGKYWTRLTADIQMKYLSDLLASSGAESADEFMAFIKKEQEAGSIPDSVAKVVDEEVIDNVLNDDYHSRLIDEADARVFGSVGGNTYSTDDYITKKSMDLPLETLPINRNLLEILTSPYISKKANTDSELGVSRFDLYKTGNPNLPSKYKPVYNQADSFFEDYITPEIQDIMSGVSGLTDEDGNVSTLGRYVLSEVVPDLTKYLLVRSLSKNADIRIDEKTGSIDFSNIKEDDITIQSLGIPYSGYSPEDEAKTVISLLKKGFSQIPAEEIETLKKAYTTRFKNKTENDYKVAEMILDRTESGLGWRIDASKDIVSVDSARMTYDDMNVLWNNVIDFWKKYNQTVLGENPHAYSTAEITDLASLIKKNKSANFINDSDAERKFLEETGITSVANYNYFFSLLPEMFLMNSIETGGNDWMAKEGKNYELRKKLDEGWSGENPGFLYQSPDDGIKYSYTFIGNHDKPRVLHGAAMNMSLFHSDFNSYEHKETAIKRLHPEVTSAVEIQDLINTTDFSGISSHAIAMADRLDKAFESLFGKDFVELAEKAVSQLAAGEYKGKPFDSKAFGTRPFEIAIDTVLNQIEYNENITLDNKDSIKANLLQNILVPAFDRFYSMYKLMMALPGSPTDFAGDKIAATGYETKAKNYHQQNRNLIHWEWLDEKQSPEYGFIREFNQNMNKISELRTRPELSALNDGDTVSLLLENRKINGLEAAEYIQAFVRYNDKSTVIAINSLSGSNSPYDKMMNRETVNNNNETRIILNDVDINAKQGLAHGIDVNSVFKNVRDDDTAEYKFVKTEIDGKQRYELKKYKDNQEQSVSIAPEDLNTLILYKVN